MATKDTGPGGGGRRPTGSSPKNRNACCSFCRKNYRDVGPLVEGPGDVYICGECIELCQSIIDQENAAAASPRRSSPTSPAPGRSRKSSTSTSSARVGPRRSCPSPCITTSSASAL